MGDLKGGERDRVDTANVDTSHQLVEGLAHLGSAHDEIERLNGKNKVTALRLQTTVDFDDLVGENDTLLTIGTLRQIREGRGG